MSESYEDIVQDRDSLKRMMMNKASCASSRFRSMMKLEDQRSVLLNALKRYGVHRPSCPAGKKTGGCNCGLQTAMEEGKQKVRISKKQRDKEQARMERNAKIRAEEGKPSFRS